MRRGRRPPGAVRGDRVGVGGGGVQAVLRGQAEEGKVQQAGGAVYMMRLSQNKGLCGLWHF